MEEPVKDYFSRAIVGKEFGMFNTKKILMSLCFIGTIVASTTIVKAET